MSNEKLIRQAAAEQLERSGVGRGVPPKVAAGIGHELPGWMMEEYVNDHETGERADEMVQELGATATQEVDGPRCGDCGALLANGCPHVGTGRSGRRYTRGS